MINIKKANFALIFAAMLLLFNLFFQISCGKEAPKCLDDDCPGMLRCQEDNKCGCNEGAIVVAGSLCVYPESHSYIATDNAGGNLPDNFHFTFIGQSDTITGPPGQYVKRDVSFYAPSFFTKGSTFGDCSKASMPPAGVTGDLFRFLPLDKVYPAGTNNGACDLIIEGTFVHPDTIATIVRLANCVPENIPEANNRYRVNFVRIYR